MQKRFLKYNEEKYESWFQVGHFIPFVTLKRLT